MNLERNAPPPGARPDTAADRLPPSAVRPWRASVAWLRRFAMHPDPLAEAANLVALALGTHLPFWPLYVWWAAGSQAWPTALLTAAFAPVFLAIPPLSRRSGLLGRIATPAAGIGNTVFVVWVLGMASGTVLFLAPCAALAALLFRRSERWLMLVLSLLPLAVWYVLRDHAPAPLHRYDAAAAGRLFVLNAISIGLLFALFGWFQAGIYRRMERR